jgi:RNA polymerase sigma factor (sigma-70 family)
MIPATPPRFMSDEIVEQHLSLARMIAYEYANIPGASLDEVVAEAQNALAAAGRCFDPEKGQFTAYAGRAIRNALNSYFGKQLRYVKANEFILDAPANQSETTTRIGSRRDLDPAADVTLDVRAAESRRILEEVIAELAPRSRQIVEQIWSGKSYAEIGAEIGISKQAVHKVGHAALQSLREKLELRGFGGIDSKGFLKSAVHRRPPRPPVDD